MIINFLLLLFQTKNLKVIQVAPDSQGCGNMSVHNTSPVHLLAEHKELNKDYSNVDPHLTEVSTREQANSDQWFEARKSRLTASNFGSVLKRKAMPSDKFLGSIFCGNKSLSAPSLDYRKRNEKNAKAKYLEKYPSRNFHQCGFVINKELSFFRGTPDGKICDDGKSSIVEIKCPYTARDYTIKEALDKLDNFCLQMDSTTRLLCLKKDHEYYAQVQGKLMITGCDFCDFVVYTKKDIHVNRLFPDITFMESMLTNLANFLKKNGKLFLNKQKKKR